MSLPDHGWHCITFLHKHEWKKCVKNVRAKKKITKLSACETHGMKPVIQERQCDHERRHRVHTNVSGTMCHLTRVVNARETSTAKHHRTEKLVELRGAFLRNSLSFLVWFCFFRPLNLIAWLTLRQLKAAAARSAGSVPVKYLFNCFWCKFGLFFLNFA